MVAPIRQLLARPSIRRPSWVIRHSLAVCLLAATARAATPTLTLDAPTTDPAEPAPGPETGPPLNEPAIGITGDWAGQRTALINHGLTLAGAAIFDFHRNFRGGVDTSHTLLNYLLDLNATLDTDKAFHLPGGTFFVDLQYHDGRSPSERLVGDAQGFSALDSPHFLALYQLWYQQKFAELASVKVGRIDANTDFSAIDHGKEFFNTAFTYTTAMYPLPTYPSSAPGIDAFLTAGPFYAGFGAFYSNRDNTFLTFTGHPQDVERSVGGTFLISEFGARWHLRGKDELAGHAALGGWAHTGRFPTREDTPESPRTSAGTGGTYFFVDQTVWQSPGPNKTTRELGVFITGGWSDPDTNQIFRQLGGGLAFTGLLPSRPNDILGLGTSYARLADVPDLQHNFELATELFYKLQLAPGLILKPDLQYINHPSGLHPDAFVATLRLEVDF